MRCIALILFISNLIVGFASSALAGTSSHYASGLAGATLGFNLADVSQVDQLNALPAGMKGLVWLGMCNGVDSAFISAVTPFIGNPRLFGFYLMDEPDPTGIWNPQCTPANLQAESDWIHANLPGAKTFIVLLNLGTNAIPSYNHAGQYYGPDNTGIDLFGIDAYTCLSEYGYCNDSLIDLALGAARAVGITDSQMIPVYQAYGCTTAAFGACVDDTGGYTFIPSPDQLRATLAHWDALLPNPFFDFAYTWNVSDIQYPLSVLPDLHPVVAEHNMPHPELVTNGGFESGLSGWSSWGNSDAVTSPVYAGTFSLRSGTASGGVYQDVTSKLVVGATYKVSFAARLGSLADQSGEIGIEFLDGAGGVISDQHLVPSSTDWTPMGFTFTYPAGVTSALIYVSKGDGSSFVYVDNYSLIAQ